MPCFVGSSTKMRGGTNSKVKVKGSCLKVSKHSQSPNLTRPSFRQQSQAYDTKVTFISKDTMDHLKSEINPPLVKQNRSFQEVLREGLWGPPLSSPVWTTTSETFGAQSNSKGDRKPLYQTASPPSVQMDDDLNVLYVADSIGSHCDFQSIQDATGANIVTKKAYGSVKDNRSLYPETNFQDVVPVQLAK